MCTSDSASEFILLRILSEAPNEIPYSQILLNEVRFCFFLSALPATTFFFSITLGTGRRAHDTQKLVQQLLPAIQLAKKKIQKILPLCEHPYILDRSSRHLSHSATLCSLEYDSYSHSKLEFAGFQEIGILCGEER